MAILKYDLFPQILKILAISYKKVSKETLSESN